MKTNDSISRILRTAAIALAACLGTFETLTPARAQEAPAPERKDYTLFNGTDFSVSQDGEFSLLVGAYDDKFKILKERKVREISRNSIDGIRFSRGQKLSSLSASVTNLAAKTIPAGSEQGPNAISTLAAPGIEGVEGPTDGLVVTSSSTGSDAFFDRFARREDVAVSFEVSAERPLTNAYFVVVTAYNEGKKDSPMLSQITVLPLHDVGPEPQKIRFVQSGFPRSFELKGSDVKIYAEGQEIATNLLQGSIALTKDEMHDFFVRNYIASREGRTAPPGIMWLAPVRTVREQVNISQLDSEVFASVDPDGSLTGLSADEEGNKKVTAQTELVMQNIGFMPALDKGVPVPGRLKVDLARMLQ